jgi:hypothetical protein
MEMPKRIALLTRTTESGFPIPWFVARIDGKPDFRDGSGGVLFDIGTPTRTLWFAQGREATRDEVLASIETGLPILREVAESEGDEAVAALERMTYDAMALVPA